MTTHFDSIPIAELETITGGDSVVSPETVGCAVGGALAAPAGPWGAAAGCIVGAALTNSINNAKDPDATMKALSTMGQI